MHTLSYHDSTHLHIPHTYTMSLPHDSCIHQASGLVKWPPGTLDHSGFALGLRSGRMYFLYCESAEVCLILLLLSFSFFFLFQYICKGGEGGGGGRKGKKVRTNTTYI